MAVVFAPLSLRGLRVRLRGLLRGAVRGGGAGLAPVAPGPLSPPALCSTAPKKFIQFQTLLILNFSSHMFIYNRTFLLIFQYSTCSRWSQ
jgi:hypothetical protein